jgi:endonuclease-3
VESRAAKILQIFQHTLVLPSLVKPKSDPFETLVITIISQNTADRNTAIAFENLSNRFKITPEALAKAQISQIEVAIKTAGLYKSKAQAIKQAAATVLKEYNGSLQPILSLPLDDARNALMQFPGVGPKTADVVLLFSAKKPTVPVDTHVNRVSKRLGLAPANGDYEAVRKNLQTLYTPEDYLAVHLLLIAHGRKTCKAPRPLCEQCPVNLFCPSKGLGGKQ